MHLMPREGTETSATAEKITSTMECILCPVRGRKLVFFTIQINRD